MGVVSSEVRGDRLSWNWTGEGPKGTSSCSLFFPGAAGAGRTGFLLGELPGLLATGGGGALRVGVVGVAFPVAPPVEEVLLVLCRASLILSRFFWKLSREW